MSLTNGNISPVNGSTSCLPAQSPRSDSDLSEPQEPESIDAIDEPSEIPQEEQSFMEDAAQDMITSESDGEEDAEGEDDDDYDAQSPINEDDTTRRASISSEDSTRPVKRKAAPAEDDDFMTQNPELYGLRRSVRILDIIRRVNG